MFIVFIMIIGAVIIFFERKNKKSYTKVFEDFFKQLCQNRDLTLAQKLTYAQQMIQNNGYRVNKDRLSVTGKRKLFSLGWFLATLSLYTLFYFYLQKPHVIVFNFNEDGSCKEESSAATT